MRSVKASEKHGRSRAQVARRAQPSPVARTSPKQAGRKGETGGLASRALDAVLSPFHLKRPMLVLTLALGGLAVLAALFIGGYVRAAVHGVEEALDAVATDAGFGISQVHIAGNARTKPDEIAAVLGLAPGQSIFGADVHAARERLMQLPWVADADVRRRFPDDISVSVVEKMPFALWQAPNGLYVIERSGGVITNKGVDEFSKLPHFVGLGAPEAGAELIDALAPHRAVAARVRAMERVGERRWNLILDDGVVVKLPEKDWQQEIATLEHLIVDNGILERDISEIDLRSKTTFFFLLRNGDQKQLERGKSA
ncbi:MAG TPA: FtsQ-type POTRA domain-containing protein [Rhizomicrobium sp.]|jgi:cell division protein FtsQ|nr:FtsQ-type POTRA domain-containing protein [Rhizomicrobium sp.]